MSRPLVFVLSCVVLLGTSGCDSTGPSTDIPAQLYRHYRAAWSADGSTIAFTGRVEGVLGIYAVDTSGANLRLIHAGDAVGAAWSPDGQTIAYSELNRIYSVPVSTDAPQLLVFQGYSIRPSWSPDGTQIAYVREGIRVLTLSTMQDVEVSPIGTSPSWRPDGTTLLASFSRVDRVSGELLHSAILVDTQTGSRSEIYTVSNPDDCDFFSMSWDGSFLVYSRKPSLTYAEIRRVDLPSAIDHSLTAEAGDYPVLSPDGTMLVYTRPVVGDGGLWLMRSDGSGKRRLTQP